MRRCAYLWAAILVAGLLALTPVSPAAAHPQQSSSSISPQYTQCVTTTETDDIEVGSTTNPYTDDMGNKWIVYYSLLRDNHNVLCGLQVVARVFPPTPDGTWKGTLKVEAFRNGSYISSAYGKLTGGSTTAPGHLVYRGPWFSPDSGSFYILVSEYNGSN